MSDSGAPGLASGGMSQAGRTTPVRITRPKVDAYDKSVLCQVICKCDHAPGVGADGRSLKQSCVSGALKGIDKAMDHQSPYKPEVNFDMTEEPPAPIMHSSVATKGHDYLPGWIKKYWPSKGDQPPFQGGRGMIRRPDMVIVKDPSMPPTQDNIKQIVEVKFPPDKMDKPQQDAYETIAGDGKVAVLRPEDCDCEKPESDPTDIPVPSSALVAALLLLMTMVAGVFAP
jgi:hypothetical protein